MLDILKKLRKEYKSYLKRNICEGNVYGLCYVACNYLDYSEFMKVQKFLQEYASSKEQVVFYRASGIKTKDKEQFIWHPKDYQVRLDWLDEQILKLKKDGKVNKTK